MPLHNSVFRIIHRTAADPHGVEGYFLHELYLAPDGTLRGWRAGISLGAPDFWVLKDHVIRLIDAFRYEPIEHRDLKTGLKITWVPVTFTIDSWIPAALAARKLGEARGELPGPRSEDTGEQGSSNEV